jgi:hypothetical protein
LFHCRPSNDSLGCKKKLTRLPEKKKTKHFESSDPINDEYQRSAYCIYKPEALQHFFFQAN